MYPGKLEQRNSNLAQKFTKRKQR